MQDNRKLDISHGFKSLKDINKLNRIFWKLC